MTAVTDVARKAATRIAHADELVPLISRPMAQDLAKGLGWFSIALGLAELFAPLGRSREERLQGMTPLLPLYGLREIASGLGILVARDPTPWVWSRVASDGLDLVTLAAAGASPRARPTPLGLAVAGVLGALVLDTICAASLARKR